MSIKWFVWPHFLHRLRHFHGRRHQVLCGSKHTQAYDLGTIIHGWLLQCLILGWGWSWERPYSLCHAGPFICPSRKWTVQVSLIRGVREKKTKSGGSEFTLCWQHTEFFASNALWRTTYYSVWIFRSAQESLEMHIQELKENVAHVLTYEDLKEMEDITDDDEVRFSLIHET